MMENIVYRHEEKYIISKMESEFLRRLLSTICKKDTYSSIEDGRYWIRSLYFDSYYEEDYQEKILGICNRKKIRLRIYDLNTSNVKLEIKNRVAEYSLKETVIIDVNDAIQLVNGNIEILLKYNSKIANKVYYIMKRDLYKSKKIVDYKREAYVYPVENIRITFDSEIKTCEDFDFLGKDLLLYPVINNDLCILEVKYDKGLPTVLKKMLSTANIYRGSYSKYCSSRNMEL